MLPFDHGIDAEHRGERSPRLFQDRHAIDD